jgi:hypothetical protein
VTTPIMTASAPEHYGAEQAGAVYGASRIKRRRASRAEMAERAAFLIDYARTHGPVTVRGLYYQAEVHAVSGIDKTDAGYSKVQRQVLALRRQGDLDYDWIADSTRWMRKPTSFDSIEQALADTAAFYRRSLWRDADDYVEVWLEKEALAGVIYPVTERYDVPLMVTKGYASETFAYEAIEARKDQRPYVVYYLGDFDRSGQDAGASLREKLVRFAAEKDISVLFEPIAVTERQVRSMRLPTRSHKRNSPADRKWPHPYACELDALPPDYMRDLVEAAINKHLPQDQLRVLKQAEASERLLLQAWAAETPLGPSYGSKPANAMPGAV